MSYDVFLVNANAYLAVAVASVFVIGARNYIRLRSTKEWPRVDALLCVCVLFGSLSLALMASFLRTRTSIVHFVQPWQNMLCMLFYIGMFIGLFGLIRVWTINEHGEREWLRILAITVVLGTLLILIP